MGGAKMAPRWLITSLLGLSLASGLESCVSEAPSQAAAASLIQRLAAAQPLLTQRGLDPSAQQALAGKQGSYLVDAQRLAEKQVPQAEPAEPKPEQAEPADPKPEEAAAVPKAPVAPGAKTDAAPTATAAEDKDGESVNAESVNTRPLPNPMNSLPSPVDVVKALPNPVNVIKDPALLMPKELFPVPTTARCIILVVCQYMVVFTALAVVRAFAEFSGQALPTITKALESAAQTVTYGPMLCVLFIACRLHVQFLSDYKEQPQDWVQNSMYFCTFAVMLSTLIAICIPFVTGKPVDFKSLSPGPELPLGQGYGFLVLSVVRYVIQLGLYGGIAGVISGIFLYQPAGGVPDGKSVYPPASVFCTIVLTVLFFGTQLIIAAATSYTEFTGLQTGRLVGVMRGASQTVAFAPMLSIVLLALRMRCMQHDAEPSPFAQNCMMAATGALAMTVILAVVVPLVLNGEMVTDSQTQQTTFTVPNEGLGQCLVVIRYCTLAGTYLGVSGVLYSITAFEAPNGPTQPVSPTVQCVMNLCIQFFMIYMLLNILATYHELSGGAYRIEESTLFASLDAAKATVQFCPMLAILFVTTRMYALLLTDKKGAPPAYVQQAMSCATWSVMVSFTMCLVTGLAMGKVQLDKDGNVVNTFDNTVMAVVSQGIRFTAMGMLYGGIGTVVYGLFNMTPETAMAASTEGVPA